MLAAVRSAALVGIDAYDVIVEVDAAQGLPQWTIVGLAASAVKESRERVGAALVNSGFKVPPKRITINLAPADVRKEGTAFDLPIAVGILVATGQLGSDSVARRMFVGELGLDGALRTMRGALSIARHAQRVGISTLVLPAPNVAEAARVSALNLSAPLTLGDLVRELREGVLTQTRDTCSGAEPSNDATDFSDVVGQHGAKRALEVAAAGGHNVLMSLTRDLEALSCLFPLPRSQLEDDQTTESLQLSPLQYARAEQRRLAPETDFPRGSVRRAKRARARSATHIP